MYRFDYGNFRDHFNKLLNYPQNHLNRINIKSKLKARGKKFKLFKSIIPIDQQANSSSAATHYIIKTKKINPASAATLGNITTIKIMSNHSDDAILLLSSPLSESFWEPGNYKKTTKRIEDGFKLCNDLMQLIQERCDIEKMYAKSLQQWSKKWNDSISKGPEYGTTEAAWKGVLSEADRLQELHLKMKDKLMMNVIDEIRQWQKEKFHKSMMQIREKKEIDDEFKRVQKPWAKILDRVNKSKHDYHMACKNEKTLMIQERNATSDTSISADQLRKIKDRVLKAHDEVAKLKEKYELSLKDISLANPRYVTEMTQVFDKCQDMEEQRLNFFKDILFNIHDCLNISQDSELALIYEEYRHTLQNADSAKDLKWWSNTYGIGMSMNWPQFEPFSEEFREIIKDSKTVIKIKNTTTSSDGITLINQHKFNEELPEWNAGESFTTTTATNDDTLPNETINTNSNKSHITNEQNNNDSIGLVDNGELGVSVKALYDYEGAEADELSFKQGDIFEKLEDEDEQGWCKGRKDNRVGLYPANYVEVFKE